MIDLYYLFGGIFWLLLIVLCILSYIQGDIDLDLDGDPDIDASSFFSFKGLIHFGAGLTGYLCKLHYDNESITLWDWIIGSIIGLILVIFLYLLYRVCSNFQNIPEVKTGEELVGSEGTVNYVIDDGTVMVNIINNGEHCSLVCYPFCTTNPPFVAGQHVTIVAYQNNKYFIS